MAAQFSTAVIFKEARAQVLSYAFFRPESAVIIASTMLCVALCAIGFLPERLWWVVLLSGVILEALIVLSTLSDGKYMSSVAAAKFYERYNASKLGIPELRNQAIQALDCHRQIFTSIKAHPNAPLGDVAHKTDEWVGRIYELAHSLDTFVADPAVIKRLQQLHDGSATAAAPVSGSKNLSLILATKNEEENETARNMDLLDDVKQVVQGATNELGASLRGMSHVQHRLNATPSAAMDWTFAKDLTVVISNHMLHLEDAGDLVDALFNVYTRADQTRPVA